MLPGTLVRYYSTITFRTFLGLVLSVNEGAGANGHQYYWVLTHTGVKNCYDGNLIRIS